MSATAGPDTARLTVAEVRDWLAANASDTERQKLLGYGIPNEHAIRVAMGRMPAFTRKRPQDPELAAAFWTDTDIVQPAKVPELFQFPGGASSDGAVGPQLAPERQLAVLSGVTHSDILRRVDLLVPKPDSFPSVEQS